MSDTAMLHKEAEAVCNEDALFILHTMVELGDTTLDYLDENLVAPHGWIALAKVWRADLIDIIGDYVTVTEKGKRLYGMVMAGIEAPPPMECSCGDGCDGVRGSASCVAGGEKG